MQFHILQWASEAMVVASSYADSKAIVPLCFRNIAPTKKIFLYNVKKACSFTYKKHSWLPHIYTFRFEVAWFLNCYSGALKFSFQMNILVGYFWVKNKKLCIGRFTKRKWIWQKPRQLFWSLLCPGRSWPHSRCWSQHPPPPRL